MPVYTDQIGVTVHLPGIPLRIVSLVPSQTELLYHLQLEDEVVGITRFCIHPGSWFRTKTRIGGTKNIHIQKVFSLEPDLIIANKEENDREQVELLRQKYPVWTSDIHNLAQALNMIGSVGDITGRRKKATSLAEKIREAFNRLNAEHAGPPVPACYLIWNDPFMTIGGDTFIQDMMAAAGFQNVFAAEKRYPVVTEEDIKNSGCRILLLSTEPYPFGPRHITEFQERFPGLKILLADGEYFSWYGSRLCHAPEYFNRLREEISSLSVF